MVVLYCVVLHCIVLCCITGLGCAFWRFTAIVAVLEYFKKWRLAAIILSGFGRVIGIFIGYAILAEPLTRVLDVSTFQSKKEGKDQESIQSCSTPDPG